MQPEIVETHTIDAYAPVETGFTLVLEGVVSSRSIAWQSAELHLGEPMIEDSLVATFHLDRDEEGELIFADDRGAAYGIGKNLDEALIDYLESAHELKDRLIQWGPRLHYSLVEQTSFVTEVLA